MSFRFLDLFAGAGGLSEGFIQAGFHPVAHVEMDSAAAYTLRTRSAFHYLNNSSNLEPYIKYIKSKITRAELYSMVPKAVIDSVIHETISEESIGSIFNKIDGIIGKEKIDLIIGGPPCQAYSIAGRSRSPNGMQGDKRNYLFEFYAEFLKKYKPKYFVFENVTGLLTAKESDDTKYLDKLLLLFGECGYNTKLEILNAEKFGIPQKRERVILVGKHTVDDFTYPMPEVEKLNWAWKYIQDLPPLHAGSGDPYCCTLKPAIQQIDEYIIDNRIPVTHHWARPHRPDDLEIYRLVVEYWNANSDKGNGRISYNQLPERLKFHNNRDSFVDRFKVVAKSIPCHTVVAHIARDGHYYIHPEIRQNRSITPREAARIQTFPDNYYFESVLNRPSRTAAYRQIGNAVPVALARKIAEKLKVVW